MPHGREGTAGYRGTGDIGELVAAGQEVLEDCTHMLKNKQCHRRDPGRGGKGVKKCLKRHWNFPRLSLIIAD